MFRRRQGNWSRGSALGSAGVVGEESTDLRTILGPELFSWHVAEQGITIAPAMFGFGSSPPAVTLSGNLSQALGMRIAVDTAGTLGTMTFKWSPRDLGGVDGAASPGVPAWTATGVVGGSNVALGSTGVSATFAAGTYTTSHYWQTSVESWDPIHGTTGAAGCRLDNSTVTASAGVLYELEALNGRPAVHCAPGMLGNQGTLGSILAGNVPFHIFLVMEASTLATSTNTLAPFAWSSQSSATERIEMLDAGSTASVSPDTWGFVRVGSAGTQRMVNTTKRSLAPRIIELRNDLTTADFKINGFTAASMAWTGTVAADRFTIGGHKLAGAAATLFSKTRFTEIIVCTAALSADKAEQVRLARG